MNSRRARRTTEAIDGLQARAGRLPGGRTRCRESPHTYECQSHQNYKSGRWLGYCSTLQGKGCVSITRSVVIPRSNDRRLIEAIKTRSVFPPKGLDSRSNDRGLIAGPPMGFLTIDATGSAIVFCRQPTPFTF